MAQKHGNKYGTHRVIEPKGVLPQPANKLDNNMDEIWDNIEGFEGYQVSNLGRVKSLGNNKARKEKILKPFINKDCYHQVKLCKNGKAKTFMVHRLVYEAFCGEIPSGYEVNHINEDKTDNRLCNLNLMTRKDNMAWGTGNERRAKALKNATRTSKPVIGYNKNVDIIVIFPSAREAGRNGYNQGCVSSCCSGKRPSHRGLIWKYLSSD